MAPSAGHVARYNDESNTARALAQKAGA